MKIGAKRRRRTAEIVEDGVAAAMREQMTQELEVESKNLRKRLEEQEKLSASNQSAANILSQFIHDGHAELND